jgi:hypothetical protein
MEVAMRFLMLACIGAVLLAPLGAGCSHGNIVFENGGAGTTGVGGSTTGGTAFAESLGLVPGKIDLVLMVDNSLSMAGKQQILSVAVSDLIEGLVNPKCLDDLNGQPATTQPLGPLEACPAGSSRAFPPVLDMHVGLLSSSLGTFGADGCPEKPPAICGTTTPNSISANDHGHLVTRTDPCGTTSVPTYASEGFLAWDPAQMLNPPGQAAIGNPSVSPPVPGFTTSIHDLVLGDGQYGCGFESQDEAWYRFLVDPLPYLTISLANNVVQTSGTDGVLLQQRQQFLRPDSLLGIVVVSDEDDCSIKELASYPLFAAPELHLPHPRQECLTKGPNDPCCASCGVPTPSGCAADPTCVSNPSYTSTDEDTALRAFGLITHKQRYGIEFFYQPSRYVHALTAPTIVDENGKTVPNPIYTTLDPSAKPPALRDPSLVLYSAIVGVPWQLLARQSNGTPDLVNGVSALDPTQIGGFKTPRELALTDAKGNTFWDDIVGDPENYVPAKSPYMRESSVPRAGTDPITGATPAPPSAPNGTDPINGHEWTIQNPPNDIEYACVFPLLAPVDCSQPSAVCDCVGAVDNPLCDPNPNDNNKPTLQTRAKAYPGLKELAIAKGMGEQGIPTSICAKQVSDSTALDYGYRPSVRSILDAMTARLDRPHRAMCTQHQLKPGAGGHVPCVVFEARSTTGACNCDAPGKVVPAASDIALLNNAKQAGGPTAANLNCFCEIPQVSGAALTTCQTAGPHATQGADGFCYIDASAAPAIGNPALVDGCAAGQKHGLRFVGAGLPAGGSAVILACSQ